MSVRNRDEAGVVLAGKYELLEKAGSGGMAVVWRARTLGAAGFTRPVAVKRIIPHLATDREFVTMFVEESRVVSELAHPAIAQIHDFGADEYGHHFLVLEWIEGCDLQELVDAFTTVGQPPPWSVMVAIAIDVLGALSAAHERCDAAGRPAPIFHRDVTPHNVRLGALGYVKLTDFGIARAADRGSITRPDAIKGKLSYVAPEMLKASPATVRTDLFAVGIVLWESITGRRLFDAQSDMEVMFKVHEAKVEDVRAIRPDVPPEIAAIVHRALSRDPDARPESARAMAHDLAVAMQKVAEPVEERRIAELVAWAKGRSTVPALPRVAAMKTTEIDLEDGD